MIFERIEKLCKDNNISVTSLCKEITGSSGNMPTWKKGNIMVSVIEKICAKFNVSADFLIFGKEPIKEVVVKKIEEPKQPAPQIIIKKEEIKLNEYEKEILRLYSEFNIKNRSKLLSYAYDLEDKINN